MTTRLGEQARLVLADNYRSVLAAERMKESAERLNSAALFRLTEHPGPAADAAGYRARFARELATQESNITDAQPLTGRRRYSPTQSAGNQRSTCATAPTSFG